MSRRAPPPAGLRIRELTRLAGVTRATVQHYLREGLLPAPRKTGRTMSYYDASCVARIRLVQSLQQRYLPLAAIRRLLQVPGEAPPLEPSVDAPVAERPETRARVLRYPGVDARLLDGLVAIGLVETRRERGRVMLDAPDVAVVRAVGRMRAAGLDPAAGFHLRQLAMYADAMRKLVRAEVALFRKNLRGRPLADLVRLAGPAMTGATDLVVALRRKALDRAFAQR